MATATLTIDRTGLALADLVFDGSDAGTTNVLVDLSEPPLSARTSYAAPSRWVDGSFPASSAWEHTNLAATVRLEGASAAALEALKLAVRAAIAQFSYEVTTTVNGVARTYVADRGSMVLASGDLAYENLRRDVEIYRLVIPVHPVEV